MSASGASPLDLRWHLIDAVLIEAASKRAVVAAEDLSASLVQVVNAGAAEVSCAKG